MPNIHIGLMRKKGYFSDVAIDHGFRVFYLHYAVALPKDAPIILYLAFFRRIRIEYLPCCQSKLICTCFPAFSKRGKYNHILDAVLFHFFHVLLHHNICGRFLAVCGHEYEIITVFHAAHSICHRIGIDAYI